MKMAFIKFDLENKENYDLKKVYLLTPNHQSAFDIFCSFCIFKGLYAFVSKDTYGKVPMVGFGMRTANYILVKRGTYTPFLNEILKDYSFMVEKLN